MWIDCTTCLRTLLVRRRRAARDFGRDEPAPHLATSACEEHSLSCGPG